MSYYPKRSCPVCQRLISVEAHYSTATKTEVRNSARIRNHKKLITDDWCDGSRMYVHWTYPLSGAGQ